MFPFMRYQAPQRLEQAINPWSWMFHTNTSDNQNGFINITTYKSNDPQLEYRITHEAAGYGMQLNAIEQALSVVLDTLPLADMTNEQQQHIKAFRQMMSDIQHEKDNAAKERFSPKHLANFIQDLQALKQQNPENYQDVVAKIKEAL